MEIRAEYRGNQKVAASRRGADEAVTGDGFDADGEGGSRLPRRRRSVGDVEVTGGGYRFGSVWCWCSSDL
ncbi:hypothetical protein PIB30_056946 [Stylosanthes scabra]|uniref:Uncharacterized protein n=1 Tax=Stylosanthes scabra TaxID=79078 RepID=A0ABU6ULJ6_9FABA|nr:hypothetical protein [Stylosanthes scabra]